MINLDLNSIKTLAINADITSLEEVANITQNDETINIQLKFHNENIAEEIKLLIENRFVGAKVVVTTNVETKSVQQGVSANKNIKNIIAIASGKGGVGKSTTAVNIALALASFGAKVGILDADIYGPSIPTMLGAKERPQSEDGKTMTAILAHGLQTMSIGFLVNEDDAMIWRGPMAVSALSQLINETNWDNLDYLIVDLPPGTGDIQLTLAQKIPVSGSVIVTTPQDISLIDAKRAVNMFAKVGIDNLGLIENMSTHICSNCGHEEHIFGKDGGKFMAKDLDLDLLGDVALDIRIRQGLDLGNPIIVAEPNCELSIKYKEIANKIAIKLAKKPKSYSQAFGNIKVEGL